MPRNPPAIPRDTSVDVWRRQMAAMAEKSVPQRLEEWAAFNRAMAEMEEAAVRRSHPDYDDHQIFLVLVRRRYGDALAFQVWPEAASVDP